MSRLIEEHKKVLAKESDERNIRCRNFTGFMQNIVDRQQNYNGWIKDRLLTEPDKFPIDCNEFTNFVKNVNAINKNINIIYQGKDSNYIETKIDIENSLVTYRLSEKFISESGGVYEY